MTEVRSFGQKQLAQVKQLPLPCLTLFKCFRAKCFTTAPKLFAVEKQKLFLFHDISTFLEVASAWGHKMSFPSGVDLNGK